MKTNLKTTRAFLSVVKKSALAISLITITASGAIAQNTFPPSGNAGVGTNSPALQSGTTNTMLEVRGTVNPGVGLTSTAAGGRQYFVYSSQANPGYFSVFDATAGADRFVISNSGNVGIGTMSPQAKLDVQGSGPYGVNGIFSAIYAKGTADHPMALILDGAGTNDGFARLRALNNGATKWQLNFMDDLVFYRWSNSFYDTLTLKNDGNVGIGTTTPGAKLEVDGSGLIRVTEGTRAVPTSGAGLELSANSTGSFVGAYNRSTSSYRRLYFYGSPYVFEGGNVGIGIENPQNKLHVGGSITVDGNINAKYQDLAEWVPSAQQLSAGTVVILDPTRSNQVVSSSVSYDTRVAGVISAQPGITLGESGEGKVLVATTGRVRVKVDASRGPIQIGDLLVTSDVQGMAMKSEPIKVGGRLMHMPGTIIGKALEPLAKGQGEILVLLSLQ